VNVWDGNQHNQIGLTMSEMFVKSERRTGACPLMPATNLSLAAHDTQLSA
jgi:hypothetical protein